MAASIQSSICPDSLAFAFYETRRHDDASCPSTAFSTTFNPTSKIRNMQAERIIRDDPTSRPWVTGTDDVILLGEATRTGSSNLSNEKFPYLYAGHRIGFYVSVTAAVIGVIFLYRKFRSKASSQPLQSQTVQECLNIIQCTPTGQPKIKSRDERQASRARPNERLAAVFGMDNAFTTRNVHAHDKFVTAATQKMRHAIGVTAETYSKIDGDWADIRETARAAVTAMLRGRERLRLVDLVRVVALKVSLRFVFAISDEAMSCEEWIEPLTLIGQGINDLWKASKGTADTLPLWSSAKNHALHEALRKVCTGDNATTDDTVDPVDPLKPRWNPMNWLLPAYETMWRVVLACVLELHFREAARDAYRWRQILQDYVDHPSTEVFKGPAIAPGVRGLGPLDIVKESLRLYPPTRHVYRRFSEDGESMIADIEGCHRSTAFGPDALSFRPERWVEMRGQLGEGATDPDVKALEESHGFMPFTTFCPAGKRSTQGFGFKMIGLLAGLVGEGLESEGPWGMEDTNGEWQPEQPLPSDRAAFDRVFLVKRSC